MTACSVIVCTRNRVGALQNCLASIVQAFAFADELSCELILIDNGSTDDTSRWANDYLSRSGVSFRVVREEKPGLAIARNAGLRHAVGDLLIFT
ncbi:MAG: glycosyltransferase family A protein, partial [Brevundimonas sp.]